jgi:dGTPase
MRLESPYCEHDGLNLSWETLEGLAKHNGPVGNANWALAELDVAYPLQLSTWPSLEAQVAAISDDIAYDNHDIDDGLRAGFLSLDELLAQPFVADEWKQVEKRYPKAPRDRQLRELVRSQIGLMVNDVLEETGKRTAGMGSADEVRSAGDACAAFSPGLADAERGLKRFMYEKLYYHPEQLATSERARMVIAELYAAYAQDPSLMDESWSARVPDLEPQRSRHIADFLAGMTDRYAINAYACIYGRTPAGLSNV